MPKTVNKQMVNTLEPDPLAANPTVATTNMDSDPPSPFDAEGGAPPAGSRLEVIISDLPHQRGKVRIVRNLDTGALVSREVFDLKNDHLIDCPHCGKQVIIPEEMLHNGEEQDDE